MIFTIFQDDMVFENSNQYDAYDIICNISHMHLQHSAADKTRVSVRNTAHLGFLATESETKHKISLMIHR